MATRRWRLKGLLFVSVLLLFASWFLYQHVVARTVLSVTMVITTCKAHPASVLTTWVQGYPVLAVTPMRLGLPGSRAMNYGSLWSGAYIGNRAPSAAIRLVSGRSFGKVDRSGPPLTFQLNGRVALDLHGRISCSDSAGFGPDMVVNGTARP